MSERARQEQERHDRLMDPENPEAGVECPFYDPETDDPILDSILSYRVQHGK